MLSDLPYALRLLRKSPGFTSVAVLSLALGIGVNAAIFSVVDGVLVRRLPFEESQRLALVWESNARTQRAPVSPANFLDWRSTQRSFEDLAGMRLGTVNLTGSGDPERLGVAWVSNSFFSLMRVQPVRGRAFRPGEDRSESEPVAVVSSSLWQRRFAADPALVGRALVLGEVPRTVIGIAPPGFTMPGLLVHARVDVWMPLAFEPPDIQRGLRYLGVLGRLRPSVSFGQARAEMSAIADRLARQYPTDNRGVGASVMSVQEYIVGSVRSPLLLLFAAVGCVLLIACANIANLLLARGTARVRELAVRAALGASRIQLVRQLLTESVLLSLAGGAVGALFTLWSLDVLRALAGRSIPRLETIGLDVNVLGFTFVLAVVTGLACGIAPVWQTLALSPDEALRVGTRVAGGARQRRLRSGLVVAEGALAFLLLVVGGLTIRSLVRLEQVDPGFRADRVFAASLTLSGSRYDGPAVRQATLDRFLDGVRTLPGVEAAAATTYLPFGGEDLFLDFTAEGRPLQRDEERAAHVRAVSPGYFQTMGIAIVRGRDFTLADRAGEQLTAMVSEGLARRYFAGVDPIGRRLRLGLSDEDGPWMTVVGVVADVKHWSLADREAPSLYVPFAQDPDRRVTLVVRAADTTSIADLVRKRILGIDPNLPIQIVVMQELVTNSVAQPRFRAILFTLFGALALMLAAMGVYGTTAFTVAQRVPELGIRLVLGATKAGVRRLVIRQVLGLVMAGLVLGAAAAAVASRVVANQLFGVSPLDASTFAAAALTLIAVGVAAGFVPAHRATSVDPLAALRAE